MAPLSEWEFIDAFHSELNAKGVPADLARMIAKSIDPDGYRLPTLPRGSFGMMIPVGYWIIRNDDLDLVKSLVAGTALALLSNTADGTVSTSAVAALIGGVVNAARAARNKGASVSPLSYKLLLVLRRHAEGMTVDEATEELNLMLDDENSALQATDVAELLRGLASTRVGDGSVVAFMEEDGAGRWQGRGLF